MNTSKRPRSSRSRKERKRAQHVDNQVQRLYAEGCDIVFTDEVTGKDASRPGWDKCVAYLRPGVLLMLPKGYVDGPELIRIAVAVVRDIDICPMAGPANSCRPDAPARSSFRRIRP